MKTGAGKGGHLPGGTARDGDKPGMPSPEPAQFLVLSQPELHSHRAAEAAVITAPTVIGLLGELVSVDFKSRFYKKVHAAENAEVVPQSQLGVPVSAPLEGRVGKAPGIAQTGQ